MRKLSKVNGELISTLFNNMNVAILMLESVYKRSASNLISREEYEQLARLWAKHGQEAHTKLVKLGVNPVGYEF